MARSVFISEDGAHNIFNRIVCNGRVRLKQVTQADIMGVLAPVVYEVQMKQRLIAELKGMGFDLLPDVPPDRYNEIYTRFRRAIREQQKKEAL